MKRKLAMLICATMMIGSLAGCGGSTSRSSDNMSEAKTSEKNVETEDKMQVTTDENVSYLMIYNPYIYNEADVNGNVISAALNTGDIGSQIITGMNRAGNLGTEITIPNVWSQSEINEDVDISGVNRDGVRAEMMDPEYELFDRHEFFYLSENMEYVYKNAFDCYYAGEHCYIWSLNDSISESDAQMMGEEFDTKIYMRDTEAFGTARFTDNGGKINLLFYPIMEEVGGFFTLRDIFSSAEVPAEQAEEYGFNTDHAIVHINSRHMKENVAFAQSTMAHEFQHLICASDSFYYAESPFMKTWLNEAMSAFAEELNYPGIKENGCYNQLFYLSDAFRKGQSLYNFDTSSDEYIGAYGAVYLFSEYLSELVGENAYFDIHSYWRNSYSASVSEAETLAQIVSKTVYEEIDNKYTYSDKIIQGFSDENEEWMSKLTLDFFIETLSMELANLSEYEKEVHSVMLYGEVNPLDIEGGGRIVVALQNNSYEIPVDADENLVYVGLDENFEPVMFF